ncbi:MAG: hypothetical protein EOP11_14100 [Proteobacteria bacterium]|nr:MAG: hypothetical protein EOP11_14100 [Pseudomonadota bacterium]
MTNLDFPALKKTFLQTVGGFAVLGAALSFWLWGSLGAILTLCAIVFLVVGFWITENLIGIFAKVKTVSPTMAIFLFTGKLLWWGALFVFSRRVPAGLELCVAIGMGAFLLSLVLAVLSHAYLPKNQTNVSNAASE